MSDSTRKQIEFIYNGGLVKRFHTVDTIKTETVAEHSFTVAWLVTALGGDKSVIVQSLFHDMAEQVVGDLPSPIKRMGFVDEALCKLEDDIFKENNLPQVSFGNYRTIKIADILSGLLFCHREAMLGNKGIAYVGLNYQSYLIPLAPFNDKEKEVINAVIDIVGGQHV